MSLTTAKASYAAQLFVDAQAPTNPAETFSLAFTAYFKNASLDSTPLFPGSETLPYALAALISGVSIAFQQVEKNNTCMFLQEAFLAYWAAESPTTHRAAIKYMWASCNPPPVIETNLAAYLIPALDQINLSPQDVQRNIADAIFKWLTTAVKVDITGTYHYFV